jgi:hypothetical protein
VLAIGHDDGAVGELDLEARALVKHVGSGDDRGREPVCAEELVADRDLTHRDPPGGRG